MSRLKFIMIPLSCFTLMLSCRTSGPGLFGKASPHEQYGRKIREAGLDKTTLGRLWFGWADSALAKPLPVSIPYRLTGYFSAEKPRAIGLQFNGRRGEKLSFQLERTPLNGFSIYLELWKSEAGQEPELVAYLDTSQASFSYEVEDEVPFILRLQPELLNSGSYSLSISIGPSLGFPVAGKSGRVGSIWGDDRDAGARSHEGIDIFATRGTPVIASTAGTVNRVEETSRGGKVVWLRHENRPLSLYYAHLDEQLVTAGQRVKQGDTLGLIGNTGNARSTPPHLHFGIYGYGGALNPLPFVDPVVKKPAPVSIPVERLNRMYRTSQSITIPDGPSLPRYTAVFVTDADPGSFLIEMPAGGRLKLSHNAVQIIDNQLSALNLKDTVLLLDKPLPGSAQQAALSPSDRLAVLGYFGSFVFVETREGRRGWVAQ